MWKVRRVSVRSKDFYVVNGRAYIPRGSVLFDKIGGVLRKHLDKKLSGFDNIVLERGLSRELLKVQQERELMIKAFKEFEEGILERDSEIFKGLEEDGDGPKVYNPVMKEYYRVVKDTGRPRRKFRGNRW